MTPSMILYLLLSASAKNFIFVLYLNFEICKTPSPLRIKFPLVILLAFYRNPHHDLIQIKGTSSKVYENDNLNNESVRTKEYNSHKKLTAGILTRS